MVSRKVVAGNLESVGLMHLIPWPIGDGHVILNTLSCLYHFNPNGQLCHCLITFLVHIAKVHVPVFLMLVKLLHIIHECLKHLIWFLIITLIIDKGLVVPSLIANIVNDVCILYLFRDLVDFQHDLHPVPVLILSCGLVIHLPVHGLHLMNLQWYVGWQMVLKGN